MAVAAEKQEKGVTFFAEFEKHPKGGYKGEMPAWYHENLLNGMKEELAAKEKALSMRVPIPNEDEVREQVVALKGRIKDIEGSRPKWSAKERDDMAKVAQELEGQIRDSMYTRSDMNTGLADPHRELARSMECKIPLPPEIAAASGVKYEKGRTNRDGAIRVWKMIQKGLDKDNETNPERLRRDKINGVEHTQG